MLLLLLLFKSNFIKGVLILFLNTNLSSNSAFNSSLTSFFISFFISLFNLLTLNLESFSPFIFFSLSIETNSENELSLDISIFFVVYDADLLSSSFFKAVFFFLLLSLLSLFIFLNNSNFSSVFNFFLFFCF